jgi:hypothetical protein
MSTLKSILRKKSSSPNRTKKHVLINPNFNETSQDNPEPITITDFCIASLFSIIISPFQG